ncbi:hypothetical protein D9M68_435560 [compost metagenome]
MVLIWLANCGCSPHETVQVAHGFQLGAGLPACTEQHQLVDQTGFGMPNTQFFRGALEFPGSVGEMPGDIEFGPGRTRDEGLKGSAPSVQGVREEHDLFHGDLRVGHGLCPQAADARLRPSFTAMSWALP